MYYEERKIVLWGGGFDFKNGMNRGEFDHSISLDGGEFEQFFFKNSNARGCARGGDGHF